MPIQRVEWTCPGCQRRYAIPATARTPVLCPECQKAGRAASATTGSTPSAANSFPASFLLEDSDAPFEHAGPPSIPPLFDATTPAAAPRRDFGWAGRGGSYPALRSISMVYKVLAALAAVGTVAALLFAIYSAVTVAPGPERTAAIWFGINAFIGATVGAVTLLAAGELIQVVLDIEENTRSR